MPTLDRSKAYVIKRGFNVFETLRSVQKEGVEEARTFIDEVVYRIVNNPENKGKLPKSRLYLDTFSLVHQKYLDNDAAWDLDTAIAFYEKLGRVYLVPVASELIKPVFSYLDKREDLEDFHYVEADKPAFITKAKWDARGRLWQSLAGVYPFSLDIVNRASFPMFSPMMRNSDIEERFAGI